VASLLINVTKSDENKKFLREILFILDEVTDERATAEDCQKIHFNPMFEDFEVVKDYCYLFLRNSISLEYKNSLKLFAFLLPMEYVFEDFIFGFIEKEIDWIDAKAHNASKYLDSDHKFGLNPDLILRIRTKKIIADTKYKIVYKDERDPKNGISQNDLYQMVAYAIRFKINEIILFYPDSVRDNVLNSDKLIIKDEFSGMDITIQVHQLPVINRDMLKPEYSPYGKKLSEEFENVKNDLNNRFKDII
jgi:5-methylcytosine-specific restriction enzyme subunit McrC